MVCQAYLDKDNEIELFNFVLILEQISSKTINTETAFSDTLDGSILIDPDNKMSTDEVAFRLRVYNASLVRKGKTEEEIIEDLLSREADMDVNQQRMDYMGRGFQSGTNYFYFST